MQVKIQQFAIALLGSCIYALGTLSLHTASSSTQPSANTFKNLDKLAQQRAPGSSGSMVASDPKPSKMPSTIPAAALTSSLPVQVNTPGTAPVIPVSCPVVKNNTLIGGYTASQEMPPSAASALAHVDTLSADVVSAQPESFAPKLIKNLFTDPNAPLSQKVLAISSRNTALSNSSPLKVKPGTKYRSTPVGNALGKASLVSFTKSKQTPNTIQVAFADSATQKAYNELMALIENNGSLLPLFRKLHLIVLHQIYQYVLGIYTALSMTHIDDVKTYMYMEKVYALNKKTLLIGHLLNLIQEQLNTALHALFPAVGKAYTIRVGMGAIEQDTGSDINMLLVDLEQAVLAVMGLNTLTVDQVSKTYVELTKHLPANACPSIAVASTVTQSKNQSATNQVSSDDGAGVFFYSDESLQNGLKSMQVPWLESITSSASKSSTPSGPSVADLCSALDVMQKNGPRFISALSVAQKTALICALNILLSHFSQNEIGQTLDAVSTALKMNQMDTLTSTQMGMLTKFVGQCAFGSQLENEISLVKSLTQLLQNKSTQSLPKDQLEGLQSIVAFLLQNYEKQALNQVSDLVDSLGQLNPSFQTLSLMQSLNLATLAKKLLGLDGTKRLRLAAVQDTDRFLLAYGFIVISKMSQFKSIASDLVDISAMLNNSPLQETDLTSSQQQSLTQALTYFSTYVPKPLDAADVGVDLTQDQLAAAQSAAKIMTAPGFKGFSELTKEQQQAISLLLNEVSRVMETRYVEHKEQATVIQALFADNPQLQTGLYNTISMPQYQGLVYLSKVLQNSSFSLADLQKTLNSIDNEPPPALGSFIDQSSITPLITDDSSETDKTSKATVADVLLQLFAAPTSPTQVTYLGVLNQLQEQHFSNTALLKLTSKLTSQDIAMYQQLSTQLQASNFNWGQVSAMVLTQLQNDLQQYKKLLSQDIESSPQLTVYQNQDQEAVNIVANVLFYSHAFSTTKNQFLVFLQKYLQFFHLYTQPLAALGGSVASDSQTPLNNSAYLGLTAFFGQAQSLSQQLAATPLESLNPPLFFFNDEVFRGLKIIPKLASLVDGTKTVPYPTFSMELAIQGSAVDPSAGQSFNNQQTVGPLTFNKFFFLDPTDPSIDASVQKQIQAGTLPAPEITGSMPSWITKVPVPTSKKDSYPYIYVPNKPLTGITGFYMNIPTFSQDPTNNKKTEIRLYEQPVIAQPVWLNASGWAPVGSQSAQSSAPSNANTTSTESEQTILAMLRGCLGDFQSLLSFSVFDPCLTVIFTKALTLSDTSTTSISADLKEACSTFISEKLADEQRQMSVKATTYSSTPTVSSVTAAAQANAGSTGGDAS